MKLFIIVLIIISVAAVGGSILYLNHTKVAPVSAPVAASAPNQSTESAAPEKIAVPKTEPTPTIATNANEPAPVAIAVATETKSDDSTDLIRKAVDALLTAKSAAQKHELFQQLIKSGELEQVIAELKQRMTDNPTDAEIPTTLGEADLQKANVISQNGGNINEMGILGMQADQSFDAALKLDPSNWEAQFSKADAMSYWPAELNKGDEVVQRLSSLIDQQETMPTQPEFSQTYVVLGNEYQKLGQSDKALATWQLGLQKFPNDPTLLQKISGQ